MSGSERKNEKEGEGGGGSEGGGGWSTFWKVAGAAAVVAGGIYSIVEEEEGGGSGGGWASTFWKVASAAAATAVVAGGLYSVLKQPEADQVEVEAGGSSGGGAVWTPPKVGWYKLNVDGSLLREIQSAGCGGVLRNSSGKWIHGFAQKLSPSSKEDETEKEGILKGLQLAKKMGVRKLEVESDNKGIVDKVNDGNRSNDPLIVAIRELLFSTYWEATLTWIRNGANGVADELADIARSLPDSDMHELYSAPRSCMKALAKDSPHLYSSLVCICFINYYGLIC